MGGGHGHRRSLSQSQSISANIDLIAKLRRQLEERDAEIAALKVTPCHLLAFNLLLLSQVKSFQGNLS